MYLQKQLLLNTTYTINVETLVVTKIWQFGSECILKKI